MTAKGYSTFYKIPKIACVKNTKKNYIWQLLGMENSKADGFINSFKSTKFTKVCNSKLNPIIKGEMAVHKISLQKVKNLLHEHIIHRRYK